MKKCIVCKKKLKKNYKNFRYKSKKRGILTFRSVCRPCERKLVNVYAKTKEGKINKKKRDKKYKASAKGRAADKRYYDKNQPKLMKIGVIKRAKQRKEIPHIKIRDNLSFLFLFILTTNINIKLKTNLELKLRFMLII